jgi:hypothetical protein
MITQEWEQPGNGEHKVFPVIQRRARWRIDTLVTSYAVLRQMENVADVNKTNQIHTPA